MSLIARLKKLEQPVHDSWFDNWEDFQRECFKHLSSTALKNILDADLCKEYEDKTRKQIDKLYGKDLLDGFFGIVDKTSDKSFSKWRDEVTKLENKNGQSVFVIARKVKVEFYPKDIPAPPFNPPDELFTWLSEKIKEYDGKVQASMMANVILSYAVGRAVAELHGLKVEGEKSL